MSSHLSLINRRGVTAFRYSRLPIGRFSKQAGKRKISYVLTTPSRRISKHRISLIRNSQILSRALFKRRAIQRAIIRKDPSKISAKKQQMYARERVLLLGARKARAKRVRARRAVARVTGGNFQGGYKLTSPNHRAQISAYQQYRSAVLKRKGSVSAGKWALPKRKSFQFQNFLKKHYSRSKMTYHL